MALRLPFISEAPFKGRPSSAVKCNMLIHLSNFMTDFGTPVVMQMHKLDGGEETLENTVPFIPSKLRLGIPEAEEI